jgi:hypothetical protein
MNAKNSSTKACAGEDPAKERPLALGSCAAHVVVHRYWTNPRIKWDVAEHGLTPHHRQFVELEVRHTRDARTLAIRLLRQFAVDHDQPLSGDAIATVTALVSAELAKLGAR